MFRNLSRTLGAARTFTSRATLYKAQVFRMPAMSPTMTEGGIVSWKLKPGDEYSAGDVLLEVETDKATIDVEAQDDGVVWELLMDEGASGIPVGKPIALLAEPGDDLSTLEKPPLEDEPSASSKKTDGDSKKTAPSDTKPAAKSAKQNESSSKTSKHDPKPAETSTLVGKANPEQKLTPAVEMLLQNNNISDEEAYANIPASGPKGRLLKGDVLAYLGKIDSSAVSKVAEYIKNKEHLDLSNIKIVPVQKEAKAAAPASEKPKPTNTMSIEFSAELGEDVSKEKFKYAFERALEAAKRQTYSARFPNYARSPVSSGLHEDDIFDDLLVAPVSKDRFEVFDIKYDFVGDNIEPVVAGNDAFDELLGFTVKHKGAAAKAEEAGSITAIVSFQVKYDAKLTDSKEFVDYFQDSLLSQIPSKQLVIRH